ncbi:MAG: tetratricopeptide repeat protein [Rhodothalassiaceae bacterium]
MRLPVIGCLFLAAWLAAAPALAEENREALRRAAEAGDGAAALALGTALLAGESDAEWAEGIAWLEKAAKQGAPVYLIIADSYAHGVGVAPDPARAADWYRIGAETGDPLAQYEIGRRYLAGDGVAPDPVQAIFYLELAVARLTEPARREEASWALVRAKWSATPDEREKVAALLRAWRPKTLRELLN